jgi:hypothetical protein
MNRDRFSYQLIDSRRRECAEIIVELGYDPKGERKMQFFSQECGEVRWYPHHPGSLELAEVKRLVAAGRLWGASKSTSISFAEDNRQISL